MRRHLLAVCVLLGLGAMVAAWTPVAAGAIPAALVALSELQAGRLLEWRLEGVPVVTNSFDPAVIRVDVEVTEPAGRRRSIPAFWCRPYRRALVQGSEMLTATGAVNGVCASSVPRQVSRPCA